ncbi:MULTISPECIES: phage tail protein [unclassified Cupriavidus]|uniref:phage tail protein n=1 Tax=unclassified Cupriavidus TaxID=2640874 RepID=UPI001365C389|nr:phage tail protein [Cupriavidus sp. SW-Y-13]MWL89298.1 phage tail protein [Cupriavidus sp. SW-Y-13]
MEFEKSRDGTSIFMPVSFSFQVEFTRFGQGADCSFQEVSGMGVTMETEDVQAGGQNAFVYKLPKGVRQEKLVMKRGVANDKSPLVGWCKDTLENGMTQPIEIQDVKVYLLDETGVKIRGWTFASAYPVRWSVDDLNSTRNEVTIETIEFAYLNCVREM